MDDTTRSITFQVKGQAYRFAPLTEDQQAALLLIPDGAAGFRKMLKVAARSMGDAQYDQITDRLIDPDDALSTKDLGKMMERLAKESAKSSDNDVADDDDD